MSVADLYSNHKDSNALGMLVKKELKSFQVTANAYVRPWSIPTALGNSWTFVWRLHSILGILKWILNFLKAQNLLKLQYWSLSVSLSVLWQVMVRDGVLISSLSQRYAWLYTVELTVIFTRFSNWKIHVKVNFLLQQITVPLICNNYWLILSKFWAVYIV